MSRLALSNIEPNADLLSQQLINLLSTNPTWATIYDSALGHTIIRWIASIGAYEQSAIERSLVETSLDTAEQNDSIIVLSRMLGVHIQRSIPGNVTCNLTAVVDTVIPAYSIFNAGAIALFNRKPLRLLAGTVQSVSLYEGKVVSEDFLSGGGPFQKFYIGAANTNSLSDLDLFATSTLNAGISTFASNQTGLWDTVPGQKVFYENTLPDGTIEILFGNDAYAAAPMVNSLITFTYVITLGAAINNTTSGLAVTLTNSNNISGVTSTPIVDGQGNKSPLFYKQFAPDLYSSKGRAVTKDDFTALALTYTGQPITDINFLAQKDIAPYNSDWINLVQYSLLTTSPSFNRVVFEAWLSSLCLFQTNFIYVIPTAIPITVSVNVYCDPSSNLDTIKIAVVKNIITLLTPGIGSIGKNIYLSDLYGAIQSADPNIIYSLLSNPTTDIIINTDGQINPPQQYISLALITGTATPNVVVNTYYKNS